VRSADDPLLSTSEARQASSDRRELVNAARAIVRYNYRAMLDAPPMPPTVVFDRRRSAVTARLGTKSALVFAGGLRGRNYPANPYPYRCSSHFLYLVGASLPDAVLWLSGERAELFMPPADPSDALWHGALPDLSEIVQSTGVDRIRPLGELASAIAKVGARQIATLPSLDPHTCARQRALLQRAWPDDRTPGIADLEQIDLDLADAMIDVRLAHDAAAIANIELAVEATTAGHLAGMAATRDGVLEHEVRAAIEREFVRRGCECAYGSIVTVHGEVLHNNAYGNRVDKGDLLLADAGAEHRGWASDVTRTWPVSGAFTPTQRAIYDIVLAANEAAIAKVAPGVRYREIHLEAARVLTRGLVDCGICHGDPDGLVERGVHAMLFPHGVGHLLGLDVHDMEDLGDRAGYAPGRTRSAQFGLAYLRLDRDLQPGMVVTIEPGIYLVDAILRDDSLCGRFFRDGSLDRARLEQFADVRGIRIEDDVLCTPTGPRVLTAAIPKSAEAVCAAVGAR
jgi:Xaa-Pro aminopeptidase